MRLGIWVKTATLTLKNCAVPDGQETHSVKIEVYGDSDCVAVPFHFALLLRPLELAIADVMRAKFAIKKVQLQPAVGTNPPALNMDPLMKAVPLLKHIMRCCVAIVSASRGCFRTEDVDVLSSIIMPSCDEVAALLLNHACGFNLKDAATIKRCLKDMVSA